MGVFLACLLVAPPPPMQEKLETALRSSLWGVVCKSGEGEGQKTVFRTLRFEEVQVAGKPVRRVSDRRGQEVEFQVLTQKGSQVTWKVEGETWTLTFTRDEKGKLIEAIGKSESRLNGGQQYSIRLKRRE